MAIFYWKTDQSQYVIMPQATVLRARYRGHRSSWKINLEMNQFAYDIYQLYYRTSVDQTTFEADTYKLEFGTSYYDSRGAPIKITMETAVGGHMGKGAFGAGNFTATPNTSAVVSTGTQDVIHRIQRLMWRVKLLEGQGW